MTPLSCDATDRLLQAFHDDELPVTEQIAVASHLEWCDRCATSLADRVSREGSGRGRHEIGDLLTIPRDRRCENDS